MDVHDIGAPRPGSVSGSRIISEIGRGGVGVALRAVRTDEYAHEAAREVIKRGLDRDFILL